MKDKIKLTNCHEHSLASNLIKVAHNVGGFRDSDDIDNAKFHAKVTLLTIKNLIEKNEWTKEELLIFVETNLEGVDLFKSIWTE